MAFLDESIAQLQESRGRVLVARDQIGNSESIVRFIDYMLSLFGGYKRDLERILNETKQDFPFSAAS